MQQPGKQIRIKSDGDQPNSRRLYHLFEKNLYLFEKIPCKSLESVMVHIDRIKLGVSGTFQKSSSSSKILERDWYHFS